MTGLELSKSAPMMGTPKHTANGIETVAGLHRFNVDALRDVAGQKVFARGAAYHEDGHVEIVTLDRARVLARVIGSEVYRCELVGSGKKFSGECSCCIYGVGLLQASGGHRPCRK